MKSRNNFVVIGVIIYIISSGINRFVYRIPDYIYIPLSLIAMTLVLIGLIQNRRIKDKK
jgi:hypothetical protein